MEVALTYEDRREAMERARRIGAAELKPCETPASPCLKCLQARSVHKLSRALMELSREVAELREDKARLDWCEGIADVHPECEKHGLVPMRRASIDAARAKETTK